MQIKLQHLIQFALVSGCVFSNLAESKKARFDNYHVYNLKLETNEQLEVIQHLEEHADGYTFFESSLSSKDINIAVPPHKLAEINELLTAQKIKNQIKTENLQKY